MMRGKTNPFPAFEYALLGLLYREPAHGYELHKIIADPAGIGIIWGIKIANLYAQLAKLERTGLIKGEEQAGEDRPARTEYKLTETGKAAFETWLTDVVQHPREFRQEFMLRYYFLAQYRQDMLNENCQVQLKDCQTWLDNSKKRQETAGKNSFTRAILEFRTSQIQSMVDWLKQLMARPPITLFPKEKQA